VLFVPYPRWSQSEAKRAAKDLVHHLPSLWRTLGDYYCEDKPNSFHADQIYRQLERLSKMVATMDGYIGNSWYECFGRRNWHHMRRILTALEKVINESYDRIFSTYIATRATEWSALHEGVARRIKPALMATVNETEVLLQVCFQSAFDGALSGVEEIAIRQVCASVREREAEFTKAFVEARESALAHCSEGQRNEQCMKDLLAEHTFALHFSSFVRTVLGFAEDLCQQRHDPNHFPRVNEMPSISSLWDRSVLSDTAHFNWSLRALFSILAGFAIGYFGVSDLFSPYDASIACTVSVLLSKFVGSAMVKNLGRIQGVVLGSIVGQIVHSLFDSTDTWSVVTLAGCLFVYALVTLFTYYSSEQYSYLGCLLAGFGCGQMLIGTGGAHVAHSLDKAGGYDKISTTVCATSLVVLFDMVFPPGRASEFAHKSLAEVVELLERALSRHFDRSVEHVRFHKGELHDAVARAESMGKEASAEPRYWRTQWRGGVFSDVVRAAYQIRYSLAAMEYSVSEDFRDGGRKNAVMRTILETPSCGSLLEVVRNKVLSVSPLVGIFVHETCDPFPASGDAGAVHSFRVDIQAAQRSMAAEIAKHPSVTRLVTAGGTLERDPLCQACVVLGSIECMLESVRDLQHTILRSA